LTAASYRHYGHGDMEKQEVKLSLGWVTVLPHMITSSN